MNKVSSFLVLALFGVCCLGVQPLGFSRVSTSSSRSHMRFLPVSGAFRVLPLTFPKRLPEALAPEHSCNSDAVYHRAPLAHNCRLLLRLLECFCAVPWRPQFPTDSNQRVGTPKPGHLAIDGIIGASATHRILLHLWIAVSCR